MGWRSMVRRLPQLAHIEQLCDVCITTKQQRTLFPKQAKYRVDKPLELVHSDLCSPISPETPGGRCYILLLVDDATRYMWIAFLADKSSTPESIKKIQAAAENKCRRKLKVFHTNNGGEFTSRPSPSTLLARVWNGSTRRLTCHSRTAWWNSATNRWLQ
jgi:hypothetical protein